MGQDREFERKFHLKMRQLARRLSHSCQKRCDHTSGRKLLVCASCFSKWVQEMAVSTEGLKKLDFFAKSLAGTCQTMSTDERKTGNQAVF